MSNKPLFEKEILEKDVLNRIKWDISLNPEEFKVHYQDREKKKLSKVKFSEIKLSGDFFRHEESLIPLHRIRKITWKGKIVWDKRRI